jgi:surface antigen
MRRAIPIGAAGALLLAGCVGAPGGAGSLGGLGGPVPAAGILPAAAPERVADAGLERLLTGEDLDAARAAQYRALEFGRAGRPVAWRNEASGRSGEVVAGPGATVNALDCRDYNHTIRLDGGRRTVRGTACRRPDGTWRAVS